MHLMKNIWYNNKGMKKNFFLHVQPKKVLRLDKNKLSTNLKKGNLHNIPFNLNWISL